MKPKAIDVQLNTKSRNQTMLYNNTTGHKKEKFMGYFSSNSDGVSNLS